LSAEPQISDSTVVLSLELGRVSNRRRIKSDTEAITTDIDRSMLHLGVDLFDAPELRACQNFLVKLKASIKLLTVPSFFRGGMYLVKLEAFEQVDKLIEEAKEEFKPLVEAFANAVDQRRDEAKERLKGAFNAALYPNREQVLAAYSISHQWLTLATPTSLKKINMALFERERVKAEEALKVATEGITALLATEAKHLSEHLIDRLTPDADGEAKQIRKGSVNGITEFLSTFHLRNIGTSEELDAQVEKIKRLMTGVDVVDLRGNETLRNDVAKGFKEVASALDALIVDKPKRYMGGDE
jgi:hypothetical protein